MSIFALSFSLFLVMNSIGAIPLFVSLLSKYDGKKQRRIILREMLIALIILLLFTFFGDDLLELIGISQHTLGIAGGTLLFIIALGMIFPKNNHTRKDLPRQEPFIVPLAMPMIAGPGAISTVIVYSEQTHNAFLLSSIVFIAWFVSLIILFLSSNIKCFMGQKGLMACQKLSGMLVSLIAIQMICSGTIHLVQDTFF
ncbi:MAG TPA: MarC family protein [Rhabdochlamydiaceae bacterium]|nr:MarC family protein [Rhabdochlamydiaceae bacterium]